MAVRIVNDRKGAPLPRPVAGRIRKAVVRAAREAGVRFPYRITVTLTGDAAIRALNAAHRGIDAPTDVLSFPLVEFPNGISRPDGADINPDTGEAELGDVVISTDRALAQAEVYGHPVEREACFLAVHGALHLLGFDHADPGGASAMEEMAEAVLAKEGLARKAGRGGKT
jgi:probable rRNA maturation factor